MKKEFFVIKNAKGLYIQSWSFAYSTPNIIYCKSPEFAMKFDSKEKANERLTYFIKNKFKNTGWKIVKVQEVHYFKEIENG